ncbi:hypothetical protein KM043_013192 [Ampulex compressa]|nr:hypothetical protein KM043_013192 [Ampulex compressa]
MHLLEGHAAAAGKTAVNIRAAKPAPLADRRRKTLSAIISPVIMSSGVQETHWAQIVAQKTKRALLGRAKDAAIASPPIAPSEQTAVRIEEYYMIPFKNVSDINVSEMVPSQKCNE